MQSTTNLLVFTVQMLTLLNLIASCCLSIFQRKIKRFLDGLKSIILQFYLWVVLKISGKNIIIHNSAEDVFLSQAPGMLPRTYRLKTRAWFLRLGHITSTREEKSSLSQHYLEIRRKNQLFLWGEKKTKETMWACLKKF